MTQILEKTVYIRPYIDARHPTDAEWFEKEITAVTTDFEEKLARIKEEKINAESIQPKRLPRLALKSAA